MNGIVFNIEKLREVALDQHGFVTTAQALDEGVSKATLSKLAARGRIERVAHGVYRVPQVPADRFDRFMLAVLWTGAPEALVSHESALDMYGVCDVNPKVIDVTVARGRRISRQGGEGYSLHRENAAAADVAWREGVPVVSLRRAIEQCLEAGTPTYLLEQAVENGLAEGFLTPAEAKELVGELEASLNATCASTLSDSTATSHP